MPAAVRRKSLSWCYLTLIFAALIAVIAAIPAPTQAQESETSTAVSSSTSKSAPQAKKKATGTDAGAVEKAKTEAVEEIDRPKPTEEPRSIEQKVDAALKRINDLVEAVLFFNVFSPFGENAGKLPFAVLWLVVGAIYCTIKTNFINLRGIWHAIRVTLGHYDNPDDHGEVSHFQALSAALSATVGLGNIAGVAVAVATGGAGATFWMIVAGFLGMSSKLVECTLGQKYREVRPDGRVMGGAMFYLSKGFAEKGFAPFGKALAICFAVLCIGGSFGGGCSFQVNQSLDAVAEAVPFLQHPGNRWVYGLVMTVLVAVVILGGIRSIARVAEKIVPLMCGLYLLTGLIIVLMHLDRIPWAISTIFERAFNPRAVYGGLLGVLVTGFQRAAFSNEAGVGSAAIAHSAAKTEYPVREGIVALLEPFIDTVIICTMSAIVIVLSGAFATDFDVSNPGERIPLRVAAEDFQWSGTSPEDTARRTQLHADMRFAIQKGKGAQLTSLALESHIPGLRYLLAVAVFLFAYSTMISWSYYGERCTAYLFGDRSSLAYRLTFLLATFLGAIVSAKNVFNFGDLMILGMAVPNIVGLFFLSGSVSRDLNEYWGRYQRGEFPVRK